MGPSDHSLSSHTETYLEIFAKSFLKKTMKQQMCKNMAFLQLKERKSPLQFL